MHRQGATNPARGDLLERYLHVLAGREPAGALIELRLRRPGALVMRQRFWPAPRARRAAETALWLAARHDVYVGVLPRTRRAGGKTALERASILWVDCDGPVATAALERFAPAPAIVVASGGGHHAYWPLTAAIDPIEAEGLNRRLAHALGADTASCDAARILRPPGTLNHKYDPPRAVRLERLSGEVFDLAALTAALPAPPEGHALSGGPRFARPRGDDPLLALEPRLYVDVLTGLEVGRDGKVSCPFHDDSTPSLHVYPTPAGGWRCYGCHRGGSVYDLAAPLWGLGTRGADFVELRARLYELLLPGQDPPRARLLERLG